MIDDTIKKDVIEEPKEISAPATDNDIIDVDLGFVEKRRFRINGDYNRMLELNVSDLNIFARLKDGYPKLRKLLEKAQENVEKIPDEGEPIDRIGEIADILTEIDKEMRDIIDYIFDSNVSEICAPSGNMYDVIGGQFRFERIIDKISLLYSNGLHNEFAKTKDKVEKKTSKYTKKRK